MIQAEVYKNSHFMGQRNDKILYYDCSNVPVDITKLSKMGLYIYSMLLQSQRKAAFASHASMWVLP